MKFLMNDQGTILLPADKCKLKIVSTWEEEFPLEADKLTEKIIFNIGNAKYLQPQVFKYELLAEVIGDYKLEYVLEPNETNSETARKVENNKFLEENECLNCSKTIYVSCYEECDEIEELRPEEYIYKYALSTHEYELAFFTLSIESERISKAGKAFLNKKVSCDVKTFFETIYQRIKQAFEEDAAVHRFLNYSAFRTYSEPSTIEKREVIQTWEGLQTSVKNILEEYGILTLDDLKKTPDTELKKMRRMSDEKIRLLREYVNEHFA